MAQQLEVFLQIDQCTLLTKRRVLVKDIASVYCSDSVVQQKIGALELYTFTNEKEKRSFSVLKVLEKIGTNYPEVAVTPLGETDFIVEYNPSVKKEKKSLAEYLKVAFVCLTSFFGSAFTIMTFNKDAAVEEVFAMIYKLTRGV